MSVQEKYRKAVFFLYVSYFFLISDCFLVFVQTFSVPGTALVRCTPKILSKKHVNFGQGLEFLNFSQGNRGQNEQNQRKNERNRRKFDKKFRVPGPYFLLKIFLFNIFGVHLSDCFICNFQFFGRSFRWGFGVFGGDFRVVSGQFPGLNFGENSRS